MDIRKYWSAVLRQDMEGLAAFFHRDAWVNWHNTNEHFTVSEFVRANCDYPGVWDGEVERIVEQDNLVITVTYVYNTEQTASCHVVSFLRTKEDKIQSIDEYWGDDGAPPEWRKKMGIGCPIV